jgi:AcrR family transcriptional regulator
MPNNVTIESIRKPRIIEAALETIAQKGFQNLTLEEVARAAGLSKGGLIHYFPSKDALMKEAFVEFFDGIFRRGRDARDLVSDPLEKVLSFDWLYNREDPEVLVGYRLFFDFMTLASQDEEFRGLFHDWVESWIELLSEPIEDGVTKGLFNVNDVEGAARTVSAIYQGLAARWYLDRETHSTEWAVDSLRRAVTLLLRGEQGE